MKCSLNWSLMMVMLDAALQVCFISQFRPSSPGILLEGVYYGL